MTLKDLWPLLKETVSEWREDGAPRLGAALAYYTVFSLAPLLIIVLFIIGMIWSSETSMARERVLAQMQDLAGPDGAQMIETMLESTRPGKGGGFATLLGVVALLFGATGVFVQLQNALNTIWNVVPKPGRGIRGFLATRLLSFGVVLVIGFLLLVSLILSALLSALDTLTSGVTPLTQFLFQVLNLIVSVGIITLLFAMIFRYLPDVEIAWRDVWVGAAITAVLFTLGKWAIGVYLGNISTASTYGAAGSLVVLLLWVYYSAQILFFGAEFTQVYARHHGSLIRPADYAMALPDIEEAVHASKQLEAMTGAAVPLPAPSTQPPVWKRAIPVALAFFVGRWLGHRGTSGED
jgi:membrane protein